MTMDEIFVKLLVEIFLLVDDNTHQKTLYINALKPNTFMEKWFYRSLQLNPHRKCLGEPQQICCC